MKGISWTVICALTGASRDVLAVVSARERSGYAGLGVLMMCIAGLSATLLTLKLTTYIQLPLGGVLIWMAAFVVYLAIETAFLNSWKPGKMPKLTALLRVGYGLIFSLLQIGPLLLLANAERIHEGLYQDSLDVQIQTKAKVEAISGKEQAEATRDRLGRAEMKAREALGRPPSDVAVLTAEAAFTTATKNKADAERVLKQAFRTYELTVEKPRKNDPPSEAQQKAVAAAALRLESAKQVMQTAVARLSMADATLGDARKAQIARLQADVDRTSTAVIEHQRNLDKLEQTMADERARGRKLSDGAAKPTLGAESAQFLKLLIKDPTVLGTSIFAITCAALLDLLTFMIKWGLRGGTHDKIVEAEDAATLYDVERKAELARLDSEAMLVEKRAAATARAVFDSKDKGTLGAEQLQTKAELMHFNSQIGGLLDHLDAVAERVQRSAAMVDAGRDAGKLDDRFTQSFRKALFTVVEAFTARLASLKAGMVLPTQSVKEG